MFSPWQTAPPPRFLADLRGCPGKQHLASSTWQMSKGYSPGQGSGFMPSFNKHGLSSSHVTWARSLLSWSLCSSRGRCEISTQRVSKRDNCGECREEDRKQGRVLGVLLVYSAPAGQRRPLGRGTLPRGPDVVGEGANLVTIWVKLHS